MIILRIYRAILIEIKDMMEKRGIEISRIIMVKENLREMIMMMI